MFNQGLDNFLKQFEIGFMKPTQNRPAPGDPAANGNYDQRSLLKQRAQQAAANIPGRSTGKPNTFRQRLGNYDRQGPGGFSRTPTSIRNRFAESNRSGSALFGNRPVKGLSNQLNSREDSLRSQGNSARGDFLSRNLNLY